MGCYKVLDPEPLFDEGGPLRMLSIIVIGYEWTVVKYNISQVIGSSQTCNFLIYRLPNTVQHKFISFLLQYLKSVFGTVLQILDFYAPDTWKNSWSLMI